MATTQEWYYAKGDQKVGPVSSADLKQLAESGSLLPHSMIWKAGWADWKRADSLKGLFPQESDSGSPPQPPPLPDKFRTARETAEQVSQKLWFLDLKFEQFATPRLIGFIFTTALIVLLLLAGASTVYVLWNFPVIQAVFILLFNFVFLALLAIGLRVFLEWYLVIFRMAEHLSYLRYLKTDE